MKKKSIIVVRYNNDPTEFIKDILAISKSYKIYIYDNSQEQLDIMNDNIYYYHDKDNGGLAKAINHCVDVAISDKVDILVYFDQDSLINIDLINNLFYSYIELEKKYSNTFVLGPQPIMTDGGNYPIKLKNNLENNIYEATEIITSGMTFNPQNVKNIGYFDEDLFLDMVDFEICWRAHSEGMLILVDKDIKMPHEVGINTIRLPFKILPISSPIRNYYQMRNILYLALFKHKKNKLTLFYYLLRRFVNVCINMIYADSRRQRLRYNLLGIKHALLKSMGKLVK